MHSKFAFAFFVFILIGLQPFFAQGLPGQFPPPPGSTNPDIPSREKKEMEEKSNELRLAELYRDTEYLIKLSTELKQFVERSNENILSVDVVKKAEEIEKLAHSVKVKMKGDN